MPAVMANRLVWWCQGWQLVCLCSVVCVASTCRQIGGAPIEHRENTRLLVGKCQRVCFSLPSRLVAHGVILHGAAEDAPEVSAWCWWEHLAEGEGYMYDGCDFAKLHRWSKKLLFVRRGGFKSALCWPGSYIWSSINHLSVFASALGLHRKPHTIYQFIWSEIQ